MFLKRARIPLSKDLSNLKDKNEVFKFEQKPIEIDTFDKIEEEKTKEKIEKRKKKRRELVEKIKALKRKKRRAQYKIEEKQFWEKLNTLNKEFEAVADIKKKENV